MTRVLLSAILVPLALGASVIQTKKMDAFSGSWLRDEVVQQNGRPLPRVSWQVDFDQTTMTLTERTEAGTVSRTVRYNLDGSETQESKPEMTHRLKWDAAKQVIILSETMVGSENPPMMGMSITETWQLSDDGKTLKVLRKFQPTDKTIPIRLGDVTYSFLRVQ